MLVGFAASSTVTLIVATQLGSILSVALIVATPAPTPVTTPLSLTVAISGFSELQVTSF